MKFISKLLKYLFKFIKTLFKLFLVLLVLICLIPISASLYVFTGWSSCHTINLDFKRFSDKPKISDQIVQIAVQAKEKHVKYHRPEESTFLTFPEWYIVYSSQEFAALIHTKMPSDFPYWQAIKQFWQSYCAVYAITDKHYPFNWENHIMIMVIGSSLTAEYLIKGAYENTMGRFSEWLNDNKQTAHDQYAYQVANEYATFIPLRPWYEFNFKNSLHSLWSDKALDEKNTFRKWERKIILSAEYSFKSFYAWVIGSLSHAAFGVADVNTLLWANKVDEKELQGFPELKVLNKVANKSYLLSFPRYQPFTAVFIEFVNLPMNIIDIAGNDIIMLSAIVPTDFNVALDPAQIAFKLPILIDPSQTRIAIVVPVSALPKVIPLLKKNNAIIEHIYDY